MTLFWKAFLIGLSIAAPVGPIGLLCIQRSLAGGWHSGLATGLGAAAADGVYGLIGALGSGALIAALVAQRSWIGAAGGLFLALLGLRTIRKSICRHALDPSAADAAPAASAWATFASTFALTLSNPMTILAFVAIFASLGAGIAPNGAVDSEGAISGAMSGAVSIPDSGAASGATMDAMPGATTAAVATMVIGVFAGSAAWWLLLSGSVAALGHRISPAALTAIDRASGSLLVLLGLWQIRLALA